MGKVAQRVPWLGSCLLYSALYFLTLSQQFRHLGRQNQCTSIVPPEELYNDLCSLLRKILLNEMACSWEYLHLKFAWEEELSAWGILEAV